MKHINKGGKLFTSWAAVLTLAASLVIMGLITACPNASGGGGNSGGNSGGEIVFSYTVVAYDDLDAYLAGASSDKINYIKIKDGIPKEWFKGKEEGGVAKAGELGKKIQAHPTKKVALKLPAEVTGLTDMNFCFKGCTNLVSIANIPSGVKNMEGCFINCSSLTQSPAIPSSVNYMVRCFSGCTNLTQAPLIPDRVKNMSKCFYLCTSLTQDPDIPTGVTNMTNCFTSCSALERVKLNCPYNSTYFTGTFLGCNALKDGGIQVPSAQLAAYTATEALTKMKVPGENEDAQKAKFSKFD